MTTCAELRGMFELDRKRELYTLVKNTQNMIYYRAKNGDTSWTGFINTKFNKIFPGFTQDFIAEMKVLFPDIKVSIYDDDINKYTFDWSAESTLGKRKDRD